MERLTNKREADAQRKEYKNRIRNGYPRNIPEERFLRLAAYEDTDLMPEEVADMFPADVARWCMGGGLSTRNILLAQCMTALFAALAFLIAGIHGITALIVAQRWTV